MEQQTETKINYWEQLTALSLGSELGIILSIPYMPPQYIKPKITTWGTINIL